MTADNSRAIESRFQQMLSKLKKHYCRITPQRMAVLRILASSEDHPSAEDVYEDVRREFTDN